MRAGRHESACHPLQSRRKARRGLRGSLAAMGGVLVLVMLTGGAPGVRAQVQPLPDPATQTPAQLPMAQAITTMCGNLDQRVGLPGRAPEEIQLHVTCANLVFNQGEVDADLTGDEEDDVLGFGLDRERRNAAVQSLNGEELQAAQQRIGEIRDTQVSQIASRLSAVRSGLGGGGLSLAGLSLDAGHALAFADPVIIPAQFEDGGWLSRLGLFVTGEFRFGDKEPTGEIEGFDFDTQGVTIGADYRVTDAFVVGTAVGYSRFNADFDATLNSPAGQELSSDGVQLSLFGSFFPTDQLFFDAIGSVGWSFYDSTRRILIPSETELAPVDAPATGDFDAFHYGLAGNVGYTVRTFGANISPLVRLEYLRAEIDGFTEQSPAPTNLTFGDQTAETFTFHIGFEADYPISTPIGVLLPSVRAEYVHDFISSDDGVLIRYANDPTLTSTFQVATEPRDQDYGIVGAGLAATLAGGWAAFVDWNTLVGLSNFDVHAVNLGVRKQF